MLRLDDPAEEDGDDEDDEDGTKASPEDARSSNADRANALQIFMVGSIRLPKRSERITNELVRSGCFRRLLVFCHGRSEVNTVPVRDWCRKLWRRRHTKKPGPRAGPSILEFFRSKSRKQCKVGQYRRLIIVPKEVLVFVSLAFAHATVCCVER
jgi:hypothetical protein